MFKLIESIGERTIAVYLYFLDLFVLFGRFILLSLNYKIYKKALIRKAVIISIYYMAVKSVFVIIFIALIFGSLSTIYFEKLFIGSNFANIYVYFIFREVAPIFTAFILIIKVVTSISVEISYMKTLNELEAIEMSGLDPFKVLCFPFFIGAIISMFSLMFIFNVVSVIGSYFMNLNSLTLYFNFFLKNIIQALTFEDIFVFFIKGFVFAFIISTVPIFHGLRTKKEITNIVTTVTGATLNSFLLCIFFNILISFIFFVV